MSRRLGMALAVACALQATSSSAAEATLDYAFFKTKVEPVFLQKRPDHVRCYVCHSDNNSAFKLEKLPVGKNFWTEEQSRMNFEVVSKLVVPGNSDASLLLTRPLAAFLVPGVSPADPMSYLVVLVVLLLTALLASAAPVLRAIRRMESQ